MQVKTTMFVKEVRKKVSGQGNEYFELDLVETLPFNDENGNPQKKDWNKMFYKPVGEVANPLLMKGSNHEVDLNFYVNNRKVGDVVYQDIKANIIQIE